MMNFDELIHEAEQLPVAEKWRLVNQLLRSLETAQQMPSAPTIDWHEFLRETYGSLRDTPIKRWEQGDYEEREPLERTID
jgi:hypothetical protein